MEQQVPNINVDYSPLANFQSGEIDSAPGSFELLKGHFKVKTSNGSGIRIPHFELLRIEVVNFERKS